VEDGHRLDDQDNICRSGSIVSDLPERGRHDCEADESQHSQANARRGPNIRRERPWHPGPWSPSLRAVNAPKNQRQSFDAAVRALKRRPAELPNVVEQSVHQLVRRLEDHDRLTRCLETEIRRRSMMSIAAESVDEHNLHDQELQTLKNMYAHITRYFYDTRIAALVSKAVEGSQSRVNPTLRTYRPYVPPFPHYISKDPPVILNKSLLNLFHPHNPPPRLLLKVCYNLLTSPSSPDVKTYNIMIRAFTISRQNSLAHMVFQSMVDRGLELDDYTIVAVINLCVKSSDFDSYCRVVANIGKTTDEHQNTGGSSVRRRGRLVLEAMINGAARFGDVSRVNIYMRMLRRQLSDSPRLSISLLTSLLKLCTQKRNWTEGKRIWNRMKGLDRVALERGEVHETDLRAYRQMFYCAKACGKADIVTSLFREARERGWKPAEVIGGVEKDKGLHFTSEVKVPHLVAITRIYERHTWSRRHENPPAHERFLGSLSEAFKSDLFSMETAIRGSSPEEVAGDGKAADPELMNQELPEGYFVEDAFLRSLEDQEPVVPTFERSEIWNEIISSRVNLARKTLGAPAEGSPGNDQSSVASRSWTPHVSSFARGSE
jgi:pentatricopeptide repeat protein